MSKYKSVPVLSSEITSKSQYLNRRDFLKAAGVVTGAALLAACVPQAAADPARSPGNDAAYSGKTDELGSPLNSFDDITHYNNFYEFSTAKDAVAPLSTNFKSRPWTVEVGGLVKNPKTYAIEDLLKAFPQEDRIYRLRCVEAWSMVIPWQGFPLANLLKAVEPTSDAKYVHFVTLMDKTQFPAEGSQFYPWPYEEGLRLDEAMNDLAILATGLYGESLPAQDGAPIRLVVPWKYGFKSIKSIVKIELVDKMPGTFWNTIAPNEYGFYANVNPDVPHPRWSQTSERRIGELTRRATLPFNGYGEQVAYLYEGMDLKLHY
ncbi:MAG: protein-methionine-sulfoxide reductase catalytic subunit MsrP [Chloroflexi bacterium]|nr:protein-methionine-sulfoxide reductase catalytic subunit MsrP [Chloroflexota bacterium]MBI1856590.1 protein-methionine-sulfoxide reductase catalytic subunit MsrP [Chloroflexota bacterium]MBI3338893.1 protein-methionine-sulfoxide reductase catalytic subunit MsrP [Chloroflexota bacterium]